MATLYEKRGRRYYPVNDTKAYDGLPNGTWLVVVEKGCTSIKRIVEEDTAGVLAAMRRAREAMVEAFVNQNKTSGELAENYTEEDHALHKKAWAAYKKIMKKDFVVFKGVSMGDVVDAGIKALEEHLKKSS